MFTRLLEAATLAMLTALGAPLAQAQFAVIDIGAITQLVNQARTLQQQLSTTTDQLTVAQSELRAMSGNRGMERLLAGTPRNYLPATWPDLESVLQGSGGAFSGLAASVRNDAAGSAILSPSQLAALPAAQSEQIQSARRLVALRQETTREALATTSQRFASLQQLINALGAATDPKATLDLQARVAAENAMLQNEQTKLQTLHQLLQAEDQATAQQMHESAVAGHGSFRARFQPIP